MHTIVSSHLPSHQPAGLHNLQVGLARSAAEMDAAKRLRYQVFADEMGARITSRRAGIDEDMFDPWCEHLIVRDEARNDVVGTYRILTPQRAARIGAYYAESEFDLTRLHRLRGDLCEVGRACIHPAYRSGAVISLLWQGLARFMQDEGHRYLAGCASISMADGGIHAARVARHLIERHLAPIEYRVRSRHPLLAMDTPDRTADVEPCVPALLRAYLRLGAWIGGEPAWDPDFNTADLFVFLSMANLAPRYARHFLKAA